MRRALWADRPPRRVEFFFEYDTGTESLGRLVDKLAGYADLATAGGPAIPVMCWLQTTAEADLRRLLGDRARVPVATATAELTTALQAEPAGQVWLPVGTGTRRRLIDLPAGGGSSL
jgi:hypothetical protein